MIKNWLILLFFGLFSARGYTQSGFISGKVTDNEDEESLVGANLILEKASDTAARYYAVSDEYGNFRFSSLESGDYLLEISYIGYQSLINIKFCKRILICKI